MNPVTELKYDTKPRAYFACSRSDMLPFLPQSCRRVLDVGCGDGAFGALIKQTRGIEVWGIEPVASSCAHASGRLDRVIEAPFTNEAKLPLESFDAVIFNDVLEHLLDPRAAIAYAKTLLSPSGVIVASIPNVRYFPVLWDLIVHGDWNYQDCGILDRTHLRFFTRKSIALLFLESGFLIESLQGINRGRRPKKGALLRLINLITAGALSDAYYLQFAIVARKSPSAPKNRHQGTLIN